MKNFIKILQQLKTKSEFDAFISGIMTSNELDQIETRIQIIKLLKQGFSQHQVAAKLGIGVATVSRGAAELKKDEFKYVK